MKQRTNKKSFFSYLTNNWRLRGQKVLWGIFQKRTLRQLGPSVPNLAKIWTPVTGPRKLGPRVPNLGKIWATGTEPWDNLGNGIRTSRKLAARVPNRWKTLTPGTEPRENLGLGYRTSVKIWTRVQNLGKTGLGYRTVGKNRPWVPNLGKIVAPGTELCENSSHFNATQGYVSHIYADFHGKVYLCPADLGPVRGRSGQSGSRKMFWGVGKRFCIFLKVILKYKPMSWRE